MCNRASTEAQARTCLKCGGAHLAEQLVNSLFRSDADPVIIRDIPSLSCRDCGETFVDDATIRQLDTLRSTGLNAETANSFLKVAVFDFCKPGR